MQHSGIILILSSPSGAGKSTLCRMLRSEESLNLGVSISVTTRPIRPSETNGVDYHFVSKEEFQTLVANNAFIEWAEVHGSFYGTLQTTVDGVLKDGKDILFDIDYQGAEQIQAKRPSDVVSVFILPPSMPELKERLTKRAENSDQDMQLRLANAAQEMQHWKEYDYILVNDDLKASFSSLKSIIEAERLKRRRLLDVDAFIQSLTSPHQEINK